MSASSTYRLKHDLTLKLRGPEGEREETRPAGSEIPLRRLKGKDLRVVDDVKGQVAATLAIMSKVTGLTSMEVDELDAEDIAGLGEVIEGFMPPGLLTGETSSAT